MLGWRHMMELLGKIRWRMLLAVAFPVGVGTGLLPQPMVVVQMPEIHEKEQLLSGAVFYLFHGREM